MKYSFENVNRQNLCFRAVEDYFALKVPIKLFFTALMILASNSLLLKARKG